MMDKKKQKQILRVLRSTFIAGALTAYSLPGGGYGSSK